MVYDIGGDMRIGAFTGLYYLASNIAAVAGPQVVGILIQLTGDNYRIMFAFATLFMILAGVCMVKVKDPFRSIKSQASPA
jgi:MFS-type transporter involved in bile tolerance (Atg22 family)